MTINLTHFEDRFNNKIAIGDTVLYHAEGRSPTVYKGTVEQILKDESTYHPYIILKITSVGSAWDKSRVGTTTRKLQSTNIFALKE